MKKKENRTSRKTADEALTVMQILELSNKDFKTALKIVKKTNLKINSFKMV